MGELCYYCGMLYEEDELMEVQDTDSIQKHCCSSCLFFLIRMGRFTLISNFNPSNRKHKDKVTLEAEPDYEKMIKERVKKSANLRERI